MILCLLISCGSTSPTRVETEDVTEEPESFVTPQPSDIEEVKLGQRVTFQASEQGVLRDHQIHRSSQNGSVKDEKLTAEVNRRMPETNLENSEDENVVDPDDVEVTTRAGDYSFVSSLLAHGDPGLVRVLLDDSKPENLQVFLHNANITIEELEDFIEV